MSLVEAIISALVGRKRLDRRLVSRGWVNPLGLKRLVVDGKQYLVKDVVSVGPNEIVVVDHTGALKTIPRPPSNSSPALVRPKKAGNAK